jgi:hypothetical protein
MTVQMVAPRRPLADRAARRILGRCALAVICASFGCISLSAFGTDLATGSSRSITGPTQVADADHRAIAVQSSAPLDPKLDYLAAHARMVDRLYDELMRWTPPPCSSASAAGARVGGC